MIDFQGLAKHYGEFSAVQPLTLTVRRGEVFGFLDQMAQARPRPSA